jgi:hypothetical protein
MKVKGRKEEEEKGGYRFAGILLSRRKGKLISKSRNSHLRDFRNLKRSIESNCRLGLLPRINLTTIPVFVPLAYRQRGFGVYYSRGFNKF